MKLSNVNKHFAEIKFDFSTQLFSRDLVLGFGSKSLDWNQEKGKNELNENIKWKYFLRTSLERGLPLNDNRLLQSFFWLSAENDRHIGWRDDDVDDMFSHLQIHRQPLDWNRWKVQFDSWKGRKKNRKDINQWKDHIFDLGEKCWKSKVGFWERNQI